MKNKVVMTFMTLVIAASFSLSAFASNQLPENETNTTGETQNNITAPLSLQDQQKQVNELLERANNQLSYVQEELGATVVQIQQLEDQIANYQKELDSVGTQYNDLQTQIDETAKQIEKIQRQYDKQDKLLRNRLVALYEAGETTFLDVLLSSGSIMDFISNYFLIMEIAQYDNQIMDDIASNKAELEEKQKKLDEDKAKLKLIKSQKQQASVLLENTKTLQQNYQINLTEEENKLNAQIEDYKRQQRELEGLILNTIYGSNYDLIYTGGVMIWPTVANTHITSHFGNRLHPIQGINKNHDGIDIGGGGYGAPVYAAADGIVIYSGEMGGYGKAIMIDHGSGIVTLYGHSQKLLVSVGTQVKQGDTIMETGSTGNSTGPHVHFEVRENGVPVDPKKYLSSQTEQ